MADKTVDFNAGADAKDSECIGISEAVTETDNSMTISQGQPEVPQMQVQLLQISKVLKRLSSFTNCL